MVKYKSLRELHRLKHTLEESTMDKVKFLMSDTSAEVTAACREALELKGGEVTGVEKDGLKVLQKMLSVRPQVVLLDALCRGWTRWPSNRSTMPPGSATPRFCDRCVPE